MAEARSGLLRKPATWLALFLLADLIAQFLVLDRGWNANPFLRVPQSDADEYWSWSERIADGELISETPFFSAPLYPYVLAVLRKCGGGLLSVYVLQTLLRTATAFVLFRLGAARFGRPAYGFAAAALFLLLGEPAFYAHRVLNSSLQLLLVAGFLWAAHRADEQRTSKRLAGAGTLLGLNLLANPTVLLALPLLPLWLGWRGKQAWRETALVAGCALALVAPAALHNWVATKDSPAGPELILLSAQAGVTFAHGNAEKAFGIYTPFEGIAMERERQNESAYRLAAEATGKEGWKSTSDFFLHQGLDWMAANPGAALRLELRKAAWLLAGQHYGDIYQITQEHNDPNIPPPTHLPAAGLPTGWLLLPALAGGIALLARRKREAVPALLMLLLPMAVVVIFWYSPRYRLPVVPAACLLAPFGLVVLAGRGSRALGIGLAGTCAIAAPLLGFTLRPDVGTPEEPTALDPADVWFDVPAMYQPEYERHVGEALMQMENFPALALERFQRTVELGGEQAIVREYMGNMRVDLGRLIAGGGDDAGAAREYEIAIREYGRAIELNPERLYAWLGRGATLAFLGQIEQALPDLRRALEIARAEGNITATAYLEGRLQRHGG
ncbi:MAG: tetratricopeptide repeat protein [Planctomycetota bacterium]|nr:tetratricopeptide repeat protein [Planctomycetota bacterium]